MSTDAIFRTSAFGGFNKSDVINYIKDFKEKEEAMLNENKDLNDQLDALKKQCAMYMAAQQTLKNQLSALESRHIDETERIKNEYEEKIKAMQENAVSNRSVEEKVGSAMLDVRRYADLLMQETCEKIGTMSQNADAAVAQTLSRMFDISAGIQSFSDKVNAILSDIIAENEQIAKELTTFKGSLKIPFETAIGNMNITALEE